MTTLCLKIKSDRAEGDGFIQMNGSENINIPFFSKYFDTYKLLLYKIRTIN